MHYCFEIWFPENTDFSEANKENILNEIEKILEPYDSQTKNEKYLEFYDTSAEEEEWYLNNYTSEYNCSSNSSAGMQLSEVNFDLINDKSYYSTIELEIEKQPMSYYTYNEIYKCYKNDDYDNVIWIKVTNIIESNHPDNKICFEGKIEVIKLPEPKKTKLTDKYETFDKYMALYMSEYKNKNGKYGHMHNPNGFWDWWQLGGRWSGHKIKGYNPRKDERNHEKCSICNGTGYREFGICNSCGNDTRDGWEIEQGIAVTWPGWNHLDVNYLHVSKIEKETNCNTIIYGNIIERYKETPDFDGNISKFIEKHNIKDGYFVTVDIHN